ncbi:elongator complex protein 5 [Actinidia eriantha]|uniref:elongator complex protein 5 n=1 Tax=Actinidia eriantha TaxID=165200 RepID=UPI00258B2F40|nr:elongator complex protein 5 [Actinidia eriantha]
MAELIRRALRDGALDGEHAPALTIKDSIDSPFGPHVFNHVLAQLSANILAGKSQSQGIVLVASSWSPSFYFDMLKSRENDVASFQKWFRVLDCYTDPLGWKDRLMECGSITNQSPKTSNAVRLCKDVRNLDNLFSSILQLGKELVGQGKGRFSVAIDSATEMIRHASISSLAALLSNLRSHDQVSCAFWLLHSDLHEIRVTSVLEYMSSMAASIEPMTRSASGQRGNYENLSLLEQNSKTGKFHVRLKRRNGRVRLMSEDFCIEQSGIKFTPRSGDGETISQSLVPKVQFNLQLSEKERIERAKVVLPFEHQGIGKPIEIYDGRQSLNENNIENSSTAEKLPTSQDPGKGEIIYFRDSDDEMPDSDEDPDDDLDI